jgi:DNA-directed RNA polymerase subunit F
MLEKVVVLVLLCGAVIGMGIYFFIMPRFDDMERLDGQINSLQESITEAKDLIDRSYFVDGNYERALERAQEAHVRFYDELTPTEALTLVQELLEARGYRDAAGLRVTEIGGAPLSISLFEGGRSINYELRELARVLDQPIIDEDEILSMAEELLEFYREIAILLLSEEEDRAEELVREAAIAATMAKLMGDTRAAELKRIIEALDTDRMSPEQRSKILDVMRLRLRNERVQIGRITASFSLSLTYSEYLDFLDYINTLPKATGITTAVLYQDISAAGSDTRSYDFSLSLFVMKPMEVLPDTSRNPMLPPEPGEDDPQKEEVDPDENGNGD